MLYIRSGHRCFIAICCFLVCVGIARADGTNPPASLVESNLWPANPAKDQNAATYFLKGFEARNQVTNAALRRVLPWVGEAEIVAPGNPISQEMAKAIKEVLAENETAFQYFLEGSRLRECRYVFEPRPTYLTKLPHLAKIKSAAQFLGLRAFWLAHTGEADAAGETLVTAVALGRSLEAEPLTISQLVRTACIHITHKSMEEVLNRVSLPPHILEQLQSELDKVEEADATGTAYAHALIGERAMSQRFFDVPAEQQMEFFDFLDDTTNSTPADRKMFLQRIRESNDLEFLDQSFEKLHELWTRDYPARSAVRDFCAAQVAEAVQRKQFLSATMLHSFPRSYVREVKGLARVRLGKTALALERYRLEHRDVYPELLSDLVPRYLSAVPRDPADGKAVQYRRVRKGYTLRCSQIETPSDADVGSNPVGPKEITFTVIAPAKR